MTANAPKPGRDELFIVLLEVLRLSPGRLLVVCIGFQYKTSNINTNGHIIAHAKGSAQTSWRRIDQPDREADKSNPSRCERYDLSCEGESHVLLPWPNQEREYMRGCFLISSKRESPPDLIARYGFVNIASTIHNVCEYHDQKASKLETPNSNGGSQHELMWRERRERRPRFLYAIPKLRL